MSGEYAGVLAEDDPLHAFLADEVLNGVLGRGVDHPVFDAWRLDSGRVVYRYAERTTGVEVVGKFYGRKWIFGTQEGEPELRAELMRREFAALQRARGLGLTGYPHAVVRPLATSEAVGCVLVEEPAPGMDLDHYLRAAVHEGQGARALAGTARVATFLADLHGRSRTGRPGSGAGVLEYLGRVIGQLAAWEVVDDGQRARLEALRERWAAAGVLEGCEEVWIHGDANPTHFWLSGDEGVTAIDLERLAPGDPAFDLGYVAGDLKHLFWWYSGDPEAGEPYVRALYAAYAEHRAPGGDCFEAITGRGRYFMACSELRIARNAWLDLGYRRRLVDHAEACLWI